ncbi:uncharacterized protein LOC144666354 [Oculina patagonica]
MAAKVDEEDCSDIGCPNQLDLFLTELAETKAMFPDDENAHVIREELHQIVQGTVLDLSGKYRLFHDAVLQQGGSMEEGTKIGQPDEFDYVLVLPALQEQLVTMGGVEPFYAENYNINFQSTKLPLKMKDLTFLDDILCPDWCDEEENEQRKSQQLIFKDGKCPWRDEIAAMVSVAISRSLEATLGNLQKWKYVARLKHPSGRTYLQILKFTNTDGLETFVSVDICLAIKIAYSSAESEPLQLLFEFWSINAVSCSRRSESPWEMSKLSSLPLQSVEKRCYRLLKYLIQTFVESHFDIYTMEYKAVIETYTLKTVFLKVLMESEKRWESHDLGQKVLRILGLIKQDLTTVKTGKSSSEPLMLHPLKVSMDYCLHPVSAEPALFPRSKLLPSRKSASEPIFQKPEAIEDQISTLIELLLMVRDTEEGRQHILSQIEAMEVLKMLLKDGTFQIPVMETLKDREKNSKSGVYNGFLLIWHVLDREDFKAFMRKSKFGIVVQPDGKEDDCIVFPKTFPVLRFLNCCFFEKGAVEDDGIEIMEMDIFDHGDDKKQVVCWNVNESVNLSSIITGKLCSFCASKRI